MERRGSDQDSGVLCTSVDEPTETGSIGSPDSPGCNDDDTPPTLSVIERGEGGGESLEEGETQGDVIVLQRPRKKTVTIVDKN